MARLFLMSTNGDTLKVAAHQCQKWLLARCATLPEYVYPGGGHVIRFKLQGARLRREDRFLLLLDDERVDYEQWLRCTANHGRLRRRKTPTEPQKP